jgi:glycosyltransferase involved in cell wall biosynthesis
VRNKNTLVILSPGFPANEADTACLPPQQVFVRALKKQYPQLNIIILVFQYPFTRNAYDWEGIPVIPFGGNQRKGLYRVLLWIRVYRKLKQLNQENNIIGILSFWLTECAVVGKRFAERHGLKQFIWILGQDAKKKNRYVARVKPNAAELVALSDFIQDEFENNYSIRPKNVIPPGIDINLFDKPAPGKDIDILCAGSLIPLKQYVIALEVIAALKRKSPNIKAIIAGKGPEKQRLQSLIEELRLQNNVQLTGELPHHDIMQLMQRAKVFLHPSTYEGFGAVCIEALYAGASVVSFVKPMKAPIPNWYIVGSKDAMISITADLLESTLPVHPINVYPVEENVRKMMKLFGI